MIHWCTLWKGALCVHHKPTIYAITNYENRSWRTNVTAIVYYWSTKSPQEPQDGEMSMGSNFQEMCFSFVESQTDDGGGQPYDVLKSTYANTVLDVTSSWAHSWRRREIEGGEVFYRPEVRELCRGINQV